MDRWMEEGRDGVTGVHTHQNKPKCHTYISQCCLCVCVRVAVQEVSEPTKEEKAVAKYLRFNCPTKSTNMMGHRVDYFVGELLCCRTRGVGCDFLLLLINMATVM